MDITKSKRTIINEIMYSKSTSYHLCFLVYSYKRDDGITARFSHCFQSCPLPEKSGKKIIHHITDYFNTFSKTFAFLCPREKPFLPEIALNVNGIIDKLWLCVVY